MTLDKIRIVCCRPTRTPTPRQAGQIAQGWEVHIPAGVAFADIFEPGAWVDLEKLMRSRGPKRPRVSACIGNVSIR